MHSVEPPLYLRLWSRPNWEDATQAPTSWQSVEGLPVYRLPIEGSGPRAWQLLSFLAEETQAPLQAARPEVVILGTARGESIALLEAFDDWQQGEGISPTLSPQTSRGTLASRLARKVGILGPAWEVSQTCLSGFIALYQAAILVRSAEATTALFGAVEAPLHSFFGRMMAALRLYTPYEQYPYVRPGNAEKVNSFALGEGVALGLLSQTPISPFQLVAIRIATAPPQRGLAFTAVDAAALEALLRGVGETPPDMVFLHAPGTQQGDTAEWQAVQKVWGLLPALSVKTFFGHSLGAAPLVSLSLLLETFRREGWPVLPYTPLWGHLQPRRWREAVLIGLGYGGTMGAIRIRYVAGSSPQS